MHQHIRKTGVFVKNRLSNTLKSYNGFDFLPSKRAPGLGFAPYSSGNVAIGSSSKREGLRSGKALALGNYLAKPVGTLPLRESGSRSIFMCSRSLLQPTRSEINSSQVSFAARAFTSKASESTNQNKSETRKELSAFEDPFDAPTNVIPEKPMSFTEGASYSLIILAGLGIAGAAAYAVFKELIFQPKEYTVFNKALKRIQDNGQVRVRIGSPITGYGSVSRNRAARQRIPLKTWVDQDGVDHVEVNFYIRGPHGAGKVFTEMFKDKEDGEWKFMYLIVELTAPNPQQLILESYIPA